MNDESNPQTQAPMQKGACTNTASQQDQADLQDITQNKANAKKAHGQDGAAPAPVRPGALSQKNLTGGTLNHGDAKDATDIDLDDEHAAKSGNDKSNRPDATKTIKPSSSSIREDNQKNQNPAGRKA